MGFFLWYLLIKSFPWILIKEVREGKYLYIPPKSIYVSLFNSQNTSPVKFLCLFKNMENKLYIFINITISTVHSCARNMAFPPLLKRILYILKIGDYFF